MSNRRFERVLVIGLDGATLDVLTPLAEQGALPNLARFLRNEEARPLASTLPAVTPVAWTTFLTGCQPAGHGVWDFRRFDHQAGQLQLCSVQGIGRPTLYDAISQSGGEVVSIDLPMTWPVRPATNGIVLGGFDSPNRAVTLQAYPQLARELQRHRIALGLENVWKASPRTWEELATGVTATQVHYRERAQTAALCDGLSDWRMMVVQFQTLDSLQHRCWHLLGHEPDRSSSLPAPHHWKAKVREALRTLDDCVGELCELANRRRAATLVVSDHGFGDFRGEIQVNQLLRQAGLQRPPTNAAWLGRWTEQTRWKLRRWQQRQQRAGGSVANVPRPVGAILPGDLQHSVASALHGDLAAMIYLHTPGRFGMGPVQTAQQYEQALADVCGALQASLDPHTGLPLFVQVWSMQDRFNVDCLERGWPDVMAVAADGFHTATKRPRPGSVVTRRSDLTGTHRRAGVLLTDCGLLADQTATAPQLCDVAPTILDLLGIAPHAAMDGRSLLTGPSVGNDCGVSTSSFLVTGAVATESTLARGTARLREQRLVESRLRALGYLS